MSKAKGKSSVKVPSRKALVVSESVGLRDSVGGRLEDDGIEVMSCPGPRAPHFSCIGIRGLGCPLQEAAGVVLLDLHPEPGMYLDTTARVSLVEYYHEHAKTVLALVDEPDLATCEIAGVAVIDRLTDPARLVATVHELLGDG